MKIPPPDLLSEEQATLREHDLSENRPQRIGYYWVHRPRRQRVFTIVRRNLPAGARILDAACAQAVIATKLAEWGYRVVALDLRPSFLRYARLKFEHGDITYVAGDATHLPFAPVFDAVILGEVIEHVAHPDLLLRSARDAVRPGGLVIVTTPNGARLRTGLPTLGAIADRTLLETQQFKPDSDGHLFLLTRDELIAEASAAGLSLVEHHFVSSPFRTGRLGARHVVSWLPSSVLELADRAGTRLPLVNAHLSEQQVAVFRAD